MKRIFLSLLLITGFIFSLSAAHIRGGELYYKYEGPGTAPNSSKYLVTLKLYIDCHQHDPGQLDTEAFLTVFSRPSNQIFDGKFAEMVKEEFISYDPNSNPCITNPPRDVCYRLRYYQYTFELPNNPSGYTIAFQRCCRIEGIQNLTPPSDDVGATYLCEIPGSAVSTDGFKNTSPSLVANDAIAVCMGSGFTFDFSGTDVDGDSLVYKFCTSYEGGGPGNGEGCLSCPVPVPGAPPPYRPLNYRSPYSGTAPMGDVTIDGSTGIVTGIAPDRVGQYVLTVCVDEYRRGIKINTHRKDIHLKVSDCMPLQAVLKPDYSYCDDFLVTFSNMQVNPPGSVYIWDFGDGTPTETSVNPDGSIQHQYADTGTYRVRLEVSLAGQCVDEAFTNARVYPGFYPGFVYDGSCLYSPFRFTDTTKSRYGNPSSWRWNFGDEVSESDTSRIRNPTWLYHTLGPKQIDLIVGSDKGCLDTVSVTAEVTEFPDLALAFKDTLICSADSLRLEAIGDGSFEWTPAATLLNERTATPLAFPKSTTTYTVRMTENSCVATDQVRVRVVDFVTLNAGPDSTICATDTIRLNPAGDGLRFQWSADPNVYFSDAQSKNSLTVPDPVTRYLVRASIGSCFSEDELTIRTVPYPLVNAGEDRIICYGDTIMLTGSTDGSRFLWDPTQELMNETTLTPLAHPEQSQLYSLFAFDTKGCPKPAIDRVLITVRPPIHAHAGNDTAIVRGQPLQLQGSGSDFYAWSPETSLSLTSISNPVSTPDRNIEYVMKTFNAEGCFDTDTIRITVFETLPDIFVPNAFAPSGVNRQLMPKAVGMSSLDYFRVYNRWGQLVFQTRELGRGWDGRVNGAVQEQGTFVWMVSGTDYTGKKVVRRGTAVMVR